MPHTSKQLTSSAAVKTGPGELHAVLLTAGADAASLTLYNNTAGSGTKLAVLKAAANTSAVFTPPVSLVFSVGLYATITGTAPEISIVYL
jgi:hypothetical protein